MGSLVLGVWLSVACQGSERAGPAVERFDSAGVEIVLANRPEGPALSLAQDPSLEVGLETGDEPYLLSGVAGASLRTDGTLVVCNSADRTLRYFDATGSHLRTGGGEGRGPGELRRIAQCFQIGDQTWVYQAPALPVEVFDASGTQARSVPIPRPNDRIAQIVDIAPDGTLVLRQDENRRGLAMGVSVLRTALYAATSDGGLTGLGLFDAGRWVRGERVTFPAAFTPTLRVAALAGGVLVGWSESWDLAFLTRDGTPLWRIRRVVDPVPVTAGHRAAFEDRVLNGTMPGGDTPFEAREVRRAIVDMMVYPDRLPAYHRVLVSRGGSIWVERGDAPRDPLPQVAGPYDAPTSWDVFTPDGTWIAVVELPARFDPLEVTEAHVVGVHRDALEVERVRVYEIARGAGGG